MINRFGQEFEANGTFEFDRADDRKMIFLADVQFNGFIGIATVIKVTVGGNRPQQIVAAGDGTPLEAVVESTFTVLQRIVGAPPSPSVVVASNDQISAPLPPDSLLVLALEDVAGITKGMAERLRARGIADAATLAEMEPAMLVRILGVSPAQASSFVWAARRPLGTE